MKIRSSNYTLSCGSIFLIAAVAAAALSQRATEKRVKLELNDTISSTLADELYDVRVYFETNSRQSPASQGLSFVVTVVNKGSSPISVLDPKDLAQPEILTEDGWPVRVPDIGLSSRIHRVTPPGETEREGAKTIALSPGQEYTFPINVVRIFPIDKSPPKKTEPSTTEGSTNSQTLVTLPRGHYKVRLRLSLARAQLSTDTGTLGTPRTLVSEWADVFLGP